MRPRPRQKIYKFYFFRNIIDFLTLGFLNKNKKEELEYKFSKIFNTDNLVCINRGRLGAYLAVKNVISQKKKKIIMSPFTIYDVVNMVICAGGIPVFSDVERKTITISYDFINQIYDDDVAAIMLTHTHCLNKDINKIINFAKDKQIFLIEDCAISYGASYNNNLVGTLGDISFFSFGIFKFISSLNGGLIISKNHKIFEKIKNENNQFKANDYFLLIKHFFKSLVVSILTAPLVFNFFSSYLVKFGFLNNIKIINNFSKNDPDPFFRKNLPKSYKKQISNSQSSVILKQITITNNHFEERKNNAKIYYEKLKDIDDLIIPKYYDNSSNSWINYPIQYRHRDKLLNHLFDNNRDLAKYYYRNCNNLKIFEKYKRNNLINIEKVVKEIIVLPTYPGYGDIQINKNISLIRKFFNK